MFICNPARRGAVERPWRKPSPNPEVRLAVAPATRTRTHPAGACAGRGHGHDIRRTTRKTRLLACRAGLRDRKVRVLQPVEADHGILKYVCDTRMASMLSWPADSFATSSAGVWVR